MIRKLNSEYEIRLVEELRKPLGLNKGDEVNVEIEGDKLIITKVKNEPEQNLMQSRLDNIIQTFKERPILENSMLDLNKTEEIRIIPETKRKKDRISYDLPDYKGLDTIKIVTDKDELLNEFKNDLVICPRCNKYVEPGCNIKVNNKLICKDCIIDLKNQLKRDIKR